MTCLIRRAAVAGAAVALLGSAGCAMPAGVDGDLTGDWAVLPEPAQMVPEAGVCHNFEHRSTVRLGSTYLPRDCTEPHRIETVYVGTFTGEAAERAGPPQPGTGAWRETYRECDEAATEYLGADFRHGRLWLGVSVPSEEAWAGDARWFRCDVTEREAHFLPTVWQDTRRGVLTDRSTELALDCFTVALDDSDAIESMPPVECTEPHQAQFAGVWFSDRPDYPDDARVHTGCLSEIAEYVGLPDDRDMPFRTGTIFDHIDEEDWDNGDRGFRCYLWRDDIELTESLAGAGPTALPIG